MWYFRCKGKQLTLNNINLKKIFMNDINKEIHRIIDTVIECSKAVFSHEHMSVTKEEVLGKSRKENAIRVRCLIAYFLYNDGLSITTIGQILGKSSRAVRYKLSLHDTFYKSSNIFRIVHAQIIRQLKKNKIDFEALDKEEE